MIGMWVFLAWLIFRMSFDHVYSIFYVLIPSSTTIIQHYSIIISSSPATIYAPSLSHSFLIQVNMHLKSARPPTYLPPPKHTPNRSTHIPSIQHKARPLRTLLVSKRLVALSDVPLVGGLPLVVFHDFRVRGGQSVGWGRHRSLRTSRDYRTESRRVGMLSCWDTDLSAVRRMSDGILPLKRTRCRPARRPRLRTRMRARNKHRSSMRSAYTPQRIRKRLPPQRPHPPLPAHTQTAFRPGIHALPDPIAHTPKPRPLLHSQAPLLHNIADRQRKPTVRSHGVAVSK